MTGAADQRNRMALDYVAAFARDGSRRFITNLDTRVDLFSWGDHVLPVTVNDGETPETFVCSARAGYIDYTLEELRHFPDPKLAAILGVVVKSVSPMLSLCDIDHIVHVNNWMMSTNLPVDLDPDLVADRTTDLVSRHPRHVLAIRSLSPRYSGALMAALSRGGWALLPCRQNYLVDDVARQTLPRRDARRDHALWQRGDFAFAELAEMSDADARRIADLYALLYLEKYSRLNAAFTEQFVHLTHRTGLIRYLVLRDQEGTIQGFGGMCRNGSHATMPLMGYNTALDQRLGLYRLAFHAGILHAAVHGLRLNMSSGATSFKRNRGATPEIEYTAFHLRHLAWRRRLPFSTLSLVARKVGEPVLKKYQL